MRRSGRAQTRKRDLDRKNNRTDAEVASSAAFAARNQAIAGEVLSFALPIARAIRPVQSAIAAGRVALARAGSFKGAVKGLFTRTGPKKTFGQRARQVGRIARQKGPGQIVSGVRSGIKTRIKSGLQAGAEAATIHEADVRRRQERLRRRFGPK